MQTDTPIRINSEALPAKGSRFLWKERLPDEPRTSSGLEGDEPKALPSGVRNTCCPTLALLSVCCKGAAPGAVWWLFLSLSWGCLCPCQGTDFWRSQRAVSVGIKRLSLSVSCLSPCQGTDNRKAVSVAVRGLSLPLPGG